MTTHHTCAHARTCPCALPNSLVHREPANTGALARALGRMLARPGPPAHTVARITHVDIALGILDALLRSGAPVPAYWIVDDESAAHTLDSVTRAYDAVSEALREVGDAAARASALRVAGRQWECLDSALCEGAPLPEPWACPRPVVRIR
ncbi:Rossmann-fold NAD(P)-binding domain-containing protein [Nocardiopsis kunsanensis]|uniref:hypothetical protein n=1 Tax=Nocardiopsis kunsanensis TaxID=141693 RepID=UPI00034A8DAA|nr:hypothetical protein [Nocardiopsis kunsanensis]